MSDRRTGILREHGAGDEVIAELLAYNRNVFAGELPARLPLEDEPFVAAWRRYAIDAEAEGLWPALRRRIVQLRFPIRAGISETEEYRAVTRRGALPEEYAAVASGLELEAPEKLQLELHRTAGGRIPLLITGARADFVALTRALRYRGEPAAVPDSMGACMVSGLNNWDRVAELRRAFDLRQPGSGEAEWQLQFATIVPRRELYQDRVLVLSDGDYSGVTAAAMGMSGEQWRGTSLAIRRDHECSHYVVWRVHSTMRNNAIDEILADYAGIVAGAGRFRADWLLRFLGLESYPAFRPGGRLANYLGDPQLSDAAFVILQRLVHAAAQCLERADQIAFAGAAADRTPMILAITRFTLEELAADDGAERLLNACRQISFSLQR